MRNGRRLLVKICGITRQIDAELVVRLGADRVGFVLAESPRRIDLDAAVEIARDLPGDVLPVGVFVNPTADEVARAFDRGAIRMAQLHGDETPEFCESLPGPWTKAIRVACVDDIEDAFHFGCAEILIDPKVDGQYGGTGVPLSRDILDAVLEIKQRQVFIAGGLGPQNVGALLSHVLRATGGERPRGIDASSRLEASPGVKDHEKMFAFFEEIDRLTRDFARGEEFPAP